MIGRKPNHGNRTYSHSRETGRCSATIDRQTDFTSGRERIEARWDEDAQGHPEIDDFTDAIWPGSEDLPMNGEIADAIRLSRAGKDVVRLADESEDNNADAA